jgi:hypothetical protein
VDAPGKSQFVSKNSSKKAKTVARLPYHEAFFKGMGNTIAGPFQNVFMRQ